MNLLAVEKAMKINVNSAKFFGLSEVSRIKPNFELNLTDRSYRPKEDNLRSDWVASVAAPAFRILAAEEIVAESFCTIGTGAGLDALAAIEILHSTNVFVTDLHDDVVLQAVHNISSNVENVAVSIKYAAGDLLAPIVQSGRKLDVLYENLPNIPLRDGHELSNGQTSSTFIANRKEPMPEFVKNYLLALHYTILKESHSVLNPNGRTLSSIGGRIPLKYILKLASETGQNGRILLYTWKQQSEPEEVIGGYAHWEIEGFGPFRFFPMEILEKTFSRQNPINDTRSALAIEDALLPHALTARQALSDFEKGKPIGHTVAVLQSSIQSKSL